MARPQEFNRVLVLQQAMSIFWKYGYEKTSLAELLKITGLSKSSLYSSFGDKRQLFLEAFDLYRSQRIKDMQYLLNSENSKRNSITIFFRMIIQDASHTDFFNGCMSINQAVELAPYDQEVRSRILSDFHQFEVILLDAIRKGQSEGSIKNIRSPEILAKILFLAFPGLQILVRSGQDVHLIEEMLNALLSNLD
ncbi:TPA: TetR/AcrR family transcriptional regulator [Acinetobacter baumannii]|nr:TetR/AcrR family transcriptional regulator [Acinetobacter baumannii]